MNILTGTLLIDGSQGEGGGQILRTGLALSALLERPVKFYNIRANRKNPGLRPQHLTSVKALTEITGAKTEGAHQGSPELFFSPEAIKGGSYRFDVQTAGATSLVVAAILPALLFAPERSEVTICGGTHVPFSPPFHYLADIFLPMLGRMGSRVDINLRRWGWYPKGRGRIDLTIEPCRSLDPFCHDKRGDLRGLELLIGLARLPSHIADRQANHVAERMARAGLALMTRIETVPSLDPGSFVFVKAVFDRTTAGFSALGRKGKPAEAVAEEAVGDFFDFLRSNGSVDRYLSDQLLPYMALAGGTSCFRTEVFSSHLLTNIAIIEEFLPVRFSLDKSKGEVSVTGAGILPG